MGVLTDKLNYLSGTKRLLREAINAVLADRGDPLLTESDPFESYPSALWASSPAPSAGSLTGSVADKLLRLNETKARLRDAINAELGAGLTEGDAFRAYGDEVWAWYFENVIFGASEQGAWYDPSDLTTLYQDAAGTTPVTADGDPVGLMMDKSGNGNHASQSVAASRPIYRTNGTLHWLEFDGVDDRLVCATGIVISQPDFIAAGFRKRSADQVGMRIFDGGGADSAQRQILYFSATANLFFAGSQYTFGASSTDWQTADGLFNGASSYVSSNGGEDVLGNAGANTLRLLTIGNGQTINAPLNGDISSIVIVSGELDAVTRAKLRQYVARKSGVTL